MLAYYSEAQVMSTANAWDPRRSESATRRRLVRPLNRNCSYLTKDLISNVRFLQGWWRRATQPFFVDTQGDRLSLRYFLRLQSRRRRSMLV